ncbi:MAG: UTP14 family protein, partial [Lachnospiraceae bacterium]|nr:UTP14 family protein [Lachnospiraceae bacterium]
MSSTNKTSLGLNMWEASDKPVRQDFVNDNVIINEKITKLNSDIGNGRYTSDLMVPQPFGAVLAWNGNTYNTPYKAGLTLSSEGIA